MTDKPTSFKDLKPTELYRSAIEDFALPVDEEDKNKKTVLLAAFVEGGVTWEDYVAQHPEVAPVEDESPTNVVTTQSVAPAVEEPVRIITAETPQYNSGDKLLVKMERKNPLYEIMGYRFTQDNPYALVSPQAAEAILREDGFRQAFPSELQEFYG